jgi:hypothetical protein
MRASEKDHTSTTLPHRDPPESGNCPIIRSVAALAPVPSDLFETTREGGEPATLMFKVVTPGRFAAYEDLSQNASIYSDKILVSSRPKREVER